MMEDIHCLTKGKKIVMEQKREAVVGTLFDKNVQHIIVNE
jgi:hypothetical protein